MAIKYTDPDDSEATPSSPNYTNITVTPSVDYDQCLWKEQSFVDTNQQAGDDVDDPLEKITYPD